jgi:integrase/recombinase XerD
VAFLLLKYAIKDFLEDQKFKNLSKYTLENYSLNLKEFQEFCTNHQIVDTSDIQPTLVKDYFHYIKNEKQNKAGTVNNKDSCVKNLFQLLN